MIQDGRIFVAGPRSQITVLSKAEIIDVRGGTILPGFINAHVHAAYSVSKLKAWAQGGVTTVRDLGALGPYTPARFEIRDTLRANLKCSRLQAVGSFINVKGGCPKAYWEGILSKLLHPRRPVGL